MRIVTKYIIFLSLLIIFSCEKRGLIVNCKDCFSKEPAKATIEVKLDPYHPGIDSYAALIKVYEGNLEDSLVIGSYSIADSEWEFEVDINKKYTFTATYATSKATYIVVDETYPKVRYENEQCTDPCYFVYDKKVNLKLKYSAK
jgi:hypothetical protein